MICRYCGDYYEPHDHPDYQGFCTQSCYDEDRLPQAIRVHAYDSEDETCFCVSMNAESKADIEHMSIVEHSHHVADVIRSRNLT